MKKSTKIAVLIAALCCIAGLAIMTLSLYMVGFDFTLLGTQKYVKHEYTVTDPFLNVQIEAETADIRFLPSEDDLCKVVCNEQEKVRHYVTVKDGTLTVRAVNERKWYDYLLSFDFGNATVTVYLPETQYERLSIQTDTGDLTMPADFSFQSASVETDTGDVQWNASVSELLSIRTDTGDVTAEGAAVQSLLVTSDTGDVRLSKINATGSIRLETDTGDLKLNALRCAELSAKTDTGDLTLADTVASASLAINSDTGDVELNRSDAPLISIRTGTGDVSGTLLTEKVFITQTDTGSIDVPKTVTGGRCEITTDTGDIEISIA